MTPKMKITLEGPPAIGKSAFAWYITQIALKEGFDVHLFDDERQQKPVIYKSKKMQEKGERLMEIRCVQTEAQK